MKRFNRCVVAAALSGLLQFAHASALFSGQNAKPASTAPASTVRSSHVVFSPPGRLDIRPGPDPGGLGLRSGYGLPQSGRPSRVPGDAFFFSQAVNYQPGNNLPLSVSLADVNGDGKLDVVVANQDQSSGMGAVSVFLGNGDGTLQAPVSYDSGGAGASSVFVTDVNGDGLPDIVVANEGIGNDNGSVSVFLGNGDGTFQPPVTYDSGGAGASSVFVMDVNGDGLPDIVVANEGVSSGDGSVGVLLNGANGVPGAFNAAVTYDSGGVDATALTLADVNGDGFPDILVANNCFDVNNCAQQQGGIAVLLNNADGSGGFTLFNSYPTAGPTGSIAVGDVDGDGILDLVAGCGTDGAVFLPGMGGGNFGTYQALPGVNGQVISVAVQDVNGDGINDVLVGLGYCPACDNGNDSGVIVLLGTGGGNFQSPLTYDSGGQQVEAIGLGVLNSGGDGNPDLVVPNACDSGNIDSNCGGNVAVLLNSFNGLTTTLIASPNPVLTGYTATYTATVTNPNGAPTGNVTFRDGGTVVAMVPVTSNQAAYSTTYAAAGTHPITAAYSLNQVSQISSIVTETVIKAKTPTVTTSAAASITASAAVLNGTINPQFVPGYAGFYWGTDSTLSSYTPSCTFGTDCPQVAANSTSQPFNYALAGLASNTTYYFKIVFWYTDKTGANKYQYGAVKSFKTEDPTVTTSAASSVTASGALLNGTIKSQSAAGSAGFYWGTDPTLSTYTASCTFGVNCPPVAANSTTQSFSDTLTGLASNTTYYFQIVFYDPDNNGANLYEYGAIKPFTTGNPTVTTSAATLVLASGAQLNGKINPEFAPGYAGFYWGTDPALSAYTPSCTFGVNCPLVTANATAQSFNDALAGLASNTVYYFETVFFDTDDNSYHYGPILSFTTESPAVTTSAATAIKANGAALNGKINPHGAPGYAGFYWGTDPALGDYTPTCTFGVSCPPVTANSTAQSFKSTLTGLSSNTTYYFQMVFYDTDDTGASSYQYGAIVSFTTP
jgi:hypothetical protein